jgi:hypothetical protein
MSTLLDADRLFIAQKARLFEVSAQYAIRAENGTQLGSIRQEGQSLLRKILRAISKFDQFMSHRLSVYDMNEQKVCGILRPPAWLRSKIHVTDAAGNAVGSIIQRGIIGKIRFSYVSPTGAELGGINSQNWRHWNFSLVDARGKEIGRITKKWAGIGKELFTTADNYLYEIDRDVTGPLRLLAFASAAGVDLALKQRE